jgi:uncharacterized protein (DUF1501 family)
MWPGLGAEQLYDRADLQATTDYRAVLSEILKVRFKNNQLGVVFPSYRMGQPIGMMRG